VVWRVSNRVGNSEVNFEMTYDIKIKITMNGHVEGKTKNTSKLSPLGNPTRLLSFMVWSYRYSTLLQTHWSKPQFACELSVDALVLFVLHFFSNKALNKRRLPVLRQHRLVMNR
jgi:hypothetical protein